ncbi:MAG: hypothetical protein LM593_06730 [Candidatus Verstraetearchaeota archaeon]|nr:hypothetical protein [Candidatus Verstraetearchaeota archaeon]
MPKYFLTLVSREWYEGFKKNIDRVDIVQGVKAWKRRTPISSGDIIVLVAKTKGESRKNWEAVGEIEVIDIKKIDKNEYEEIKKKGRIYEPPIPDFSRGPIDISVVKNFKEYPVKVKLSELCNVKTRRSKEPICKWAITGVTPIDELAIQGIRKKVLVKMIVELGKILGFHVTSEEETPDKLHKIDVTWRYPTENFPQMIFEVEFSSNLDIALAKLMHAFHIWHSNLYLVVADERKKEEAMKLVEPKLKSSFASIADKLTIVGTDDIIGLYKRALPIKELTKGLIEELLRR